MKINLKKYIPEQLKSIWFWIYVLIVIIVINVLKTNLSHPYKIISLITLVIFQFVYNKKVKYKSWIDIVNWILFAVLILVSLAYLFSSYGDPDMAGIMILLMITLVLISATFSYVVHLWKIKDSSKKNSIINLVLIIILYLALSINVIYLFSFFFTVSGAFAGNEVALTNGTKITEIGDMAFYSGSVYYLSVFGDAVPNGFSRWITLIEYAISNIIHIIILGIVISGFVNPNKRKKK